MSLAQRIVGTASEVFASYKVRGAGNKVLSLPLKVPGDVKTCARENSSPETPSIKMDMLQGTAGWKKLTKAVIRR